MTDLPEVIFAVGLILVFWLIVGVLLSRPFFSVKTEMNEAACIRKLGWEEVNLAVFEQTRTHFDLPCFCDEPCYFLSETGQCTYSWPELEAQK